VIWAIALDDPALAITLVLAILTVVFLIYSELTK